MKKALILNGATPYMHAKGELGASLCDIAQEQLHALGFETRRTNIASGYDIDEQIQNLLWANVWIWQIPGWWMGEPWTVKKYIDEVFTQSKGALYINDGRSRRNPSSKYGSGGLGKEKYYMFSWTWNLPKSAFDKGEFFDGRDVDEVCLHLHKIFEFLGMNALPTFMCNDVIKNPDINGYFKRYKEHICSVFGE